MEGYELSIVVNRPIEDVFAILADLENDIKWRREWVEAKKTSEGPMGVGSTIRMVGELLGRSIPTVYEVIEYEPNRRAGWKTVSGPLPLNFYRTFVRVEGGTQFTTKYTTDARGLFKLILSLLAGSVKQQHQNDLHKVKEMLETRAL